MTTCKALKKMSAILAGVMMFGVSANALVLEENFHAEPRLSELGWTYEDTQNMEVRGDISVVDGKLSVAALGWIPKGNYKWVDFYKTFDNDIKSGKVKLSFVMCRPTENSFANSAEEASQMYTISLTDGKDTIAKAEIACNYKFIKLNGVNVAPDRNEIAFSVGKDVRVDLVVDYDAEKCYLYLDGKEIENKNTETKEVAETVTGEINVTNPATEFKFEHTNGTVSYEPIMIDEISLWGENFLTGEIDEEIFADTFDDEEKVNLDDYGYKAGKDAYVYRTEEGIHIKNGYTGKGTAIWLTKLFDKITEGKVVFDFNIKAYQIDGETRVKPYDSDARPLVSLNEGETRRFTLQTGSDGNLNNMFVNGTKIYTKLTSSDMKWTSDYFTDIRFIVDLDNDIVDIYAYNPNTMEYSNIYKESLAMTEGEGIDSISFGRAAFGGTTYPGWHHITNLKAYTINDGGYTTPVIMEDGRNMVTEIASSKTVDIYSVASNVVENPNAKLIVCFYDESDKFVAMDTKDFTYVSSGVETGISNIELLKFSYTFPENVTAGSKFKAFVWNGIDDMVPLTATAEIEMPEAE